MVGVIAGGLMSGYEDDYLDLFKDCTLLNYAHAWDGYVKEPDGSSMIKCQNEISNCITVGLDRQVKRKIDSMFAQKRGQARKKLNEPFEKALKDINSQLNLKNISQYGSFYFKFDNCKMFTFSVCIFLLRFGLSFRHQDASTWRKFASEVMNLVMEARQNTDITDNEDFKDFKNVLAFRRRLLINIFSENSSEIIEIDDDDSDSDDVQIVREVQM